MKTRSLLIVSLLFAGLFSSANSAIAEASLDEILQEVKALREKVSSLESRLADLESAIVQPIASEKPMDEASRTRWLDRLRADLHKAEVKAVGGWTVPENWTRIKLGMDEKAALEILGEPNRSKFSIRKDTDLIHQYEGDLDGNGTLIEGEVRIYKGKVSDLLAPEF